MIDYLLIGNVTKDLKTGGSTPGGTALYSAVTAQRLGLRVGLVTRVPDKAYLETLLPDVALHVQPTEQPSTFENRYQGNDRVQILHYAAAPLTLDDVPVEWRQAPMVHLGPIALEAHHSLISCFPNSLLCATPQGWMRKWDEEGVVSYTPLDDVASLFRPIDVLVFSAEDVNHDPSAMRELIDSVPIAVVTEAVDGAVVHTKDGARSIPGRPANVVDPTGAGDVFAAAYFVRLHESGDPYEAAAFANVVASFSIEHEGAPGIPYRAEVEAWIAKHR
ncbi:MAG: PfkB family carbohydrate kinase [Ardenticatenaceae bacterium]